MHSGLARDSTFAIYKMNHSPVFALSALCVLAAASAAQDLQPGANFANSPTVVPQTTSYSYESHLFDADNDGDLDAFVTQGGTWVSLQSRLWISNASTAGTSFVFTDATAGSLPVLLSQAESVVARDIDRDGDLDLLLVNSSQLLTQGNVWLVNQGGAQGGTTGVFAVDASRWVHLGGSGSSIAASLLISSGAFAGSFSDWSTNCTFADVDLDGDCDMMQNGAGPNFTGSTMSRLFLNDGDGQFEEYNPSGTVSGATSLAPGSAAGWCEGTQSEGSTNTTGAQHDITPTSFHSQFADVDQDFDLDLVIQSRTTQSRFYQNRFVDNSLSLGAEVSGTRLYRDTTASTLALTQTGGVCMDLQFADLDSDDDVDLWGMSYISLQERILTNDGTGTFGSIGSPLGDPGADENNVDFIDYDADGDLDVVAANYEGINFLYKNHVAQGASTATANSFLKRTGVLGTETEISSPGTVANSWLSVDTGDLDNDRDVDLVFSQDGSATSASVQLNTLGIADATAPRLPRIQLLSPLGNPCSVPRLVAAQVYENASASSLREASGSLKFTVNGGPAQTKPVSWAGGNIVRAEFPGYWYGTIQYWIEVTDRAGNTGSSQVKSVVLPQTGFSTFGSGVPGCSGPMNIQLNSCPTVNNPEFEITCTGAPANSLQLCLISDSQGTGLDLLGIGIPIWADFLAATELLGLDAIADGAGTLHAPAAIPDNPLVIGNDYYLQFICLDATCTPNLYTSQGAQITIQP